MATLPKFKNPEFVREYNKKYYESHKHIHVEYWQKNKEAINARRKAPVFCEVCKCNVQHRGFTRHLNTEKHRNLNLLKDKAVKEDKKDAECQSQDS